MSRPKVGSMFAGIGGICLGFKQNGFEIVWANDFDIAVCKTYRKNFGNGYLIEKDIRKVEISTIPNVDILTAGFPCQPFSIAGMQKGFKDSRGNLFFEIARVVDYIRPQIIFLENVENLIKHDDEKTFLVIYTTLAQFGYSVRYKVMQADNFGNIPQPRSRIFIIAFKDLNKCDAFKFPEPIELTTKTSDIINRTEKKHEIYYYKNTDSIYSFLLNNVKDENSIYSMSEKGLRKVKNNLCPTLTATMGIKKNRVPVVKDNYSIRKLTIKECLEFQGFPKEFKFPSSIKIEDAYKQIGNSVCVPVIKRIAEEILKVL